MICDLYSPDSFYTHLGEQASANLMLKVNALEYGRDMPGSRKYAAQMKTVREIGSAEVNKIRPEDFEREARKNKQPSHHRGQQQVQQRKGQE